MQTRREAGGRELPAEAQARRPQRRAELRGRGAPALRPPAVSHSSRPLPLPRRLQHRAAGARGRRKPEEGGPGQGQRPHDSLSAGQAGGAGEGAAPSGVRPPAGVRIPGGCAERLRSLEVAAPVGLLAPDARGPRPPPSSPRKVQCRAGLWGLRALRSREAGKPPSPTFRAGRTPAARPGRASGTENHHDGRAGGKRRVASGQGMRHRCVKR
ncbi:translation initiation factor IF-2-like [Hyaena hyaena]|uniref:translation initiation factor IF-2-like n=1 Tax=Hyaena hyaena TaxID=95912 RepID=UPI00192061FE|nr:translation initiation factor IF-2-like [Hyaena hyaena]